MFQFLFENYLNKIKALSYEQSLSSLFEAYEPHAIDMPFELLIEWQQHLLLILIITINIIIIAIIISIMIAWSSSSSANSQQQIPTFPMIISARCFQPLLRPISSLITIFLFYFIELFVATALFVSSCPLFPCDINHTPNKAFL